MSTQWLSVEEVAKELGLTEDTIRSYIRRGELVAHRFGNTYRIKKEDLDRFIDERRTKRDDD